MRISAPSLVALVLTHTLAAGQGPPAPPGLAPPVVSPQNAAPSPGSSAPSPGSAAPAATSATPPVPAATTSNPPAPLMPAADAAATPRVLAVDPAPAAPASAAAPVPAVDLGAPEPTVDAAKDGNHHPTLDVLMRVHTRYIYSDLDPTHFFELRRARLGLEFEPTDSLAAELDLDAADAPAVKDAFITLKAHRALRVTAGQFKKPFSRISLMSSGRLPLWSRGITNDALVGDQNFGGRDIGVSVGGRVKPLRYELGVFNGNGTAGEIDSGKDVAMRVEVKPVKPLSIGLSGSMKHRNVPNVDYARSDLWAGGVDLGLELGKLESVIEVLGAQGTETAAGPWQVGALGYVLYRIPLSKHLELRPIAKLEFLDDDVSSSADHAVALMAGANLHIGEPVRLMLQAEQITAEAGSAASEERRLVLQLAFDMNYSVQLSAAPAEKK